MSRSLPLICIATIIIGFSAARAQEGVSVPLALAEGRGCYVSPTGAGLWSALWNEETLYLEAEDAENLTMQEGHDVLEDPDCGGGRCLARVTNAEFPLRIAEAGTYQGWARALLPFPASWTHVESMDGGGEQQIRDSNQRVFGEWYWTPLAEYSLSAGQHRFRLHNWLGGAKLDCIVFSANPELDPAVLRGVPAGPEAQTGTVLSRPVLPSAVARWGAVSYEAELNEGAVSAEVSADGGDRWVAADRISDLPTRGDGTDALLVRFTLTAAEDGGSPVVRAATLGLQLAPDAEAVLETDHYRIAVARDTGRLAGILNRATGTAATPLHLQESFVGLAVREPGGSEMTLIPPDELQFEGLAERPDGLAVEFSAADGSIRSRVEMSADGTPLSDWTITVANRSDLEVIRVDFPLLRNAAIADFRDDEVVIPKTGGWRIEQPASSKTWTAWYLGSASMSWMDLCDAEAGLYLAMLDRELTTTEIESAPAAGNRGADLSMRTHTLIGPGEAKTRRYQVGVHPGDWHWAADPYREWALSWMEPPDNPEWVQWTDGWVGAMAVPFDHMTGKLAQARHQGISYLQYWGQMADGIDQCCGNFYWPAPALGGAEGFREGIAAVHEQGGRVTAYMNCQTWTPDSAINDALRRTPKSELPREALSLIHPIDWFNRWRLYQIDGEAQGYYASTLGWYIMCPASTGFQEHLRFWVADMYAHRFGIDGVYIDQTGATGAKPCYNLDHGHDDIGDWGSGNVQMLRTSLAAAREVRPEFIIAIEGCGDALGQYASLHLISGLCTHPEVYHYTFPEHILISGLSNASHLSLHQRISRAFLNGDRFDSRIRRAGLESALRLRRRIRRWLYPARFMDTIGLQVSDDQVLARWNRLAEDGERALVLTFDNEERVEGARCSLELPEGWPRPQRVAIYDREGEARVEEPRVTDGALQIEVPASTISAAVALYEVAPHHAVDVWQASEGEGGESTSLDLRGVNLTEEPVMARVAMQARPPLRVAEEPLALTIPASGVARAEMDVEGVADLQRPTLVMLRVSWPGGERQSIAELRPLLLNPGMSLNDDGDDTPDYWIASGTTHSFPRGVEEGSAWIGGMPEEVIFFRQRVPLQPETEYFFAAEIKRSEGEGNVSAAVVEHVGERGLRVHKIGTNEEATTDTWERFETTFTTGAEFRTAAVYLYNTKSQRRAWFRTLELRKVE